jgi:hypothetical protein
MHASSHIVACKALLVWHTALCTAIQAWCQPGCTSEEHVWAHGLVLGGIEFQQGYVNFLRLELGVMEGEKGNSMNCWRIH